MYLDFRNASILKRGKISLLCPGKKEFVVFQNGSERLDVLSPFCRARNCDSLVANATKN